MHTHQNSRAFGMPGPTSGMLACDKSQMKIMKTSLHDWKERKRQRCPKAATNKNSDENVPNVYFGCLLIGFGHCLHYLF